VVGGSACLGKKHRRVIPTATNVRSAGRARSRATAVGYAELQQWAERHDDSDELVFGIEGAGSWGAGLCQQLQHAGHAVVEVERPRRTERRAGKSDRIDALAAAKHVIAGEKLSTPRRRGTLGAAGAAERPALHDRGRHAAAQPAPGAQRDRPGRAARARRRGHRQAARARLLSMRSRPSADIEERPVFGVMRDLAARSRALAGDAQRYER
jgi:transposase